MIEVLDPGRVAVTRALEALPERVTHVLWGIVYFSLFVDLSLLPVVGCRFLI